MISRRKFIKNVAVIATTSVLFSGCTNGSSCSLKENQILHTVNFDLKYPLLSEKALEFLKQGKVILEGIPGVLNFQAFRQVSQKNDFQYGFSMVFNSKEDFKTYNDHPIHVEFVNNRWLTEVTRFQEADFEII